ncbi:MAG: F0F1 ATP synthase subunit delta [Gammaproteobacteria bacterium]
MAERNTIARPYANAAFAYAKSKGQLADWSALLAAAGVVAGDTRVKPLLGNPRIQEGALADLVVGVAAESVSAGESGVAAIRHFIHLLEVEGRIGLLPEIADLYEELFQAEQNSVDVVIESALEIGAAQRELIEKSLAKRLDRKVDVAVKIDETLLGGAVIRVGDQVIDGSVKGRLQQLAATLKH